MLVPKIALILSAPLLLCSLVFAGPEAPRRVKITASRFSYSPNQITLKKGEPVVLVLRSADVTHGLTIPDMNIAATEIKKGKDSEIPLTPTQTGRFTGQCAHFCGTGHGSMILQIDVVE